MKRKTGFAALLAGIILLTGCREAVPVERETSESDSGGIQIYTYTTEGSFAPEETSGPPPTVPTESEQATVSETASETTAEPRDPLLPETLEEFSFPPEFYDALEELIARYGLNEGRDKPPTASASRNMSFTTPRATLPSRASTAFQYISATLTAALSLRSTRARITL